MNQATGRFNSNDTDILENISKNNGLTSDINLSNIGAYPFPPIYKISGNNELKLLSFNCVGALWSPSFAAYVFLIHSVTFMSYSFVFDNEKENSESARELFKSICDLVEIASTMDEIKDMFHTLFLLQNFIVL